MTSQSFISNRHAGSALISTLLMIIVLTIIVTAFLQSMSLERQTANSYLNRYRAQLAAEAGIADFLTRLSNATANTSFHYTVNTLDPTKSNERLQIQPLAPNSATASQSPPIDLFAPSSNEDSIAMTIISGTFATRITRNANWQALQDDTGNKIARYAFWADEANAKQDALSLVGSISPAKRDTLANLAEIPILTRNKNALTQTQRQDLTLTRPPSSVTTPILTPKTLNQVLANLDPPADDFDFALKTRTHLLTPEGKPRLNIARLKCYIDGDTYEEKDAAGQVILQVENPTPLALDQGPTSPRFQLVKDLLNESGNFPADKENYWGYGNLEFVRKIFQNLINGNPVQARQFVANLIDYIDSDIIPTSDGSPGQKPPTGSQSGAHPSLQAYVINQFSPPPTVIGTEARLDPNTRKIIGHPYITYVGQGFIFNNASTRVLGWVGLAYPWETQAPWRIGSGGYSVEMQIAFGGSASGTRGPQVMAETSSDPNGYFLHGWLAQESSYRGEYSTKTLIPKSYILFPRGFNGSLDLANGYFGSTTNPNPNPANIAFTNLTSTIELLRLIYTVKSKRYLVQDLGILKNLPRKFPSPYKGSFKVKLGSTYNGITDWHFFGDPRLNFKQDGWTQLQTTFPSSETDSGSNGVQPEGSTPVYPGPTGTGQDPLQEMDPNPDKWWKTASAHFPTSSKGYRPSPLSRTDAELFGTTPQPAMLNYSEFGFLNAGEHWKTLTLYNDTSRFSYPYDTADWRLLDYIDLGTGEPREPSETGVPKIEGQINVNSGKPATLQALFTELPNFSGNAEGLSNVIINSPKKPFLQPSAILDDPALTNGETKDFDKERLIGQILPALTTRSNRFTVYAIGQALGRKGQIQATMRLQADIELIETTNGSNTTQIIPKIISTQIQ